MRKLCLIPEAAPQGVKGPDSCKTSLFGSIEWFRDVLVAITYCLSLPWVVEADTAAASERKAVAGPSNAKPLEPEVGHWGILAADVIRTVLVAHLTSSSKCSEQLLTQPPRNTALYEV